MTEAVVSYCVRYAACSSRAGWYDLPNTRRVGNHAKHSELTSAEKKSEQPMVPSITA
jgi:hypothetical protein